MGELSRIGSLVIYLRFYDTRQHHKPHVHVKNNEDEAVVALDGHHVVALKGHGKHPFR